MKTPLEYARLIVDGEFLKDSREETLKQVESFIRQIQQEAWEDGYNTAKKDVIEFEGVD